jgi:hypothetical protein
MTVVHEVRQVLWVNTPHGVGQVLFVIDYGIHLNSVWVITLKEDGRIMHYDTNQISIERNHTMDFNLENK